MNTKPDIKALSKWIAILMYSLVILSGCVRNKDRPAESDPVEMTENTVWDLLPKTTLTIDPDIAVGLAVSDGDLIVELSFPRGSVTNKTSVSAELIREDDHYLIKFEPALSLKIPAIVTVLPRAVGDDRMVVLSQSQGVYGIGDLSTAQGATISSVKVADTLWISKAAAAQTIAGQITVPTFDCSTMPTAEEVGEIQGFAELLDLFGNTDAAAQTRGGLAERASAALNALLQSSPPADPCGQYLQAMLQLIQILSKLGVSIGVSTSQLESRLGETLTQCPLDFEIDFDVHARGPSGYMLMYSTIPFAGTIPGSGETQVLNQGMIGGGGDRFTLTMQGTGTVTAEHRLSDPFEPRAVFDFPAFNGQITANANDPEVPPIVLDINVEESGSFSLSIGAPTVGTFLNANGTRSGDVMTTRMVVAGLGGIIVTTSASDVEDKIIFPLKHEAIVLKTEIQDDMLVSTVFELTIPGLTPANNLSLCPQ